MAADASRKREDLLRMFDGLAPRPVCSCCGRRHTGRHAGGSVDHCFRCWRARTPEGRAWDRQRLNEYRELWRRIEATRAPSAAR